MSSCLTRRRNKVDIYWNLVCQPCQTNDWIKRSKCLTFGSPVEPWNVKSFQCSFLFLLTKAEPTSVMSIFCITGAIEGKSSRKKVELKRKCEKCNTTSYHQPQCPQMILEIFHFKLRNLGKMDLAILQVFSIIFA